MNVISYKKIVKLALPVTISQGVILINGMVDLAFISPLGTEAIAAVAVANVICATLINFFEGFRLGTTVLVAGAAKDTKKIAGIFNTALLLALMAGSLITIAAPFISSAVYNYIASSQMADHGIPYFTYWLCVMGVSLVFYTLVGFFRGLGDTLTPLYAGSAMCVFNAILDYILIYVYALGAKGSALATLTANITGTLALFSLLLGSKKMACYINFHQSFLPYLKDYLKLSAEIGSNIGLVNLALVFFMVIIEVLGPAQLAIYQITHQIFLFAYMPGMGFLITASILAAELIGKKEHHLLIGTITKIGKISFLTILLTSGAIYLSAPYISAFFSPTDGYVTKEAVKTIRVVCIAQLFCSVYMVLRGALTGQRDTRFIVYEGLFTAYAVFLPLAYLLSIKSGYGVIGGYIAFLIWCLSDCLALFIRFYYVNCRR